MTLKEFLKSWDKCGDQVRLDDNCYNTIFEGHAMAIYDNCSIFLDKQILKFAYVEPLHKMIIKLDCAIKDIKRVYKVTMTKTFQNSVVVESVNEDAAIEIAKPIFQKGTSEDNNIECCSTEESYNAKEIM